MIGRDFFTLVEETTPPAVVTVGAEVFLELTPKFRVPIGNVVSGLQLVAAVGSASESNITLGGAYVVGEEVRVTITSNATSRQLWRKSYDYIVQPGDALADVVSGLHDKIQADGLQVETPYNTANLTGTDFDIIAKTDDKNALSVVVFTDSAAGTIVETPTPAVISEGQPDDLLDRGVDAADITLGAYTTYRFDYHGDTQVPFIDTPGSREAEIFYYGDPANDAALLAVIGSAGTNPIPGLP
jgi:hypothetical protein